MRNYLVVGLYRNGRIGDPSLLYPNGTHVYGTGGTPGVAYLDGFIIGKTQQSVLAERPWGPPAPDGGPTPAPDPQAPLAGIGYPSGCTSVGSSMAWLALPLLASALLRRRMRRG